MKKVFVVGAGFSGLVAAWRLQKDGHSVVVIEKAARSGGMIATLEHPLGLVETAANGLLASQMVEELFADCGLEIQQPKKSARRRYLAVGGKLLRFPLTFLEAVQSLWRLISIQKNPPLPEEALDAWVTRAVGEPAARKIVAPAMLGIYASDSKDLSANLIAGKYLDSSRPRTRSGRLRGTVSAKGGLETLLKHLRSTLENRGVTFQSQFGATEKSMIVLALPAWEAARFLKSHYSGDPRIKTLEEVVSIPLLSVTLFLKQRPPKLGFGTLFAQFSVPGENDGILGCLQNSEIFEGRANAGVHSETWILGGNLKGNELIDLSDDEVLRRIIEKRDRLIDVKSRENLLGHVTTRWPRAIPHYSTRLEAILPVLQEPHGRVLLFGNYLGNLGLASILESTRDLSETVGREL